MTRLMLMFSILVFALQSPASGTRVGDGGHGVACPGARTMLLDLYEASQTHGRALFFPWADEQEDLVLLEYRLRVAQIMGEKHPSLVIFDEAAFFLRALQTTTNPMPMTLDLGAVGDIPPGCKVVQIAVRGPNIMNVLIEVDRNFWSQSTPRERVLVAIHEAAHTWFPTSEIDFMTGTTAIRQFVGLLATGPFYLKSNAAIRDLLLTRQAIDPARLNHAALL